MARSAGWTLRRREHSTAWRVRFRHDGRRYDVSTGERDSIRARDKAAQIYAEAVSRQKLAPAEFASRAELDPLTAEWIADLEATHDKRTAYQYECVASRWPWQTLGDITARAVADWQRERLRTVTKETVRKHTVSLRSFLAWCVERGHLSTAPTFAPLPRRAVGVRARDAYARTPLTEAEAARFIAELPEWNTTSDSHARHRVRVRDWAIVAWETALRPITLARLRTPEHYTRGATSLHLSGDIDKARFDRPVPLSSAATAALDRCLPKTPGLIFGSHDHRKHFEAAGKAALGRVVKPYDLRHSRITLWVESGANLLGVQWLAGHKSLETTAKYAHAREAAASGIVRGGGSAGGSRRRKITK